MRTTLAIDDDVLESAREYADRHKVSLGRAVSELVRRGLRAECPIVYENGWPVFDLGPDAPTITNEDVARIEAEGY